MTSAPSIVPSLLPSILPSSTMPTTIPTATGAIVFVDMNKLVTSSLTDDEITDIVTGAENIFGVYPGDVEVQVTYDITGSITIDTENSNIPAEEILSVMQDSIATTLNVHPSDVSVSIDPESGVVSYTVSSSSAEDASNLQELLQNTVISDAIESRIFDELPAVSDVISTFF